MDIKVTICQHRDGEWTSAPFLVHSHLEAEVLAKEARATAGVTDIDIVTKLEVGLQCTSYEFDEGEWWRRKGLIAADTLRYRAFTAFGHSLEEAHKWLSKPTQKAKASVKKGGFSYS